MLQVCKDICCLQGTPPLSALLTLLHVHSWTYQMYSHNILLREFGCQDIHLIAIFYFGAASRCAQASTTEFLTCESQISYS